MAVGPVDDGGKILLAADVRYDAKLIGDAETTQVDDDGGGRLQRDRHDDDRQLHDNVDRQSLRQRLNYVRRGTVFVVQRRHINDRER